jgi:glucoamylase
MSSSSVFAAPNGPGTTPHWTSSAKDGVGTSIGRESEVWFCLSHGVVDEVYYPQIDHAVIKDCGLVVTDCAGFYSDERHQADHTVALLEYGVPAYRLTNTCEQSKYTITKEIITDPQQDVLLQEITFKSSQGSLEDYHLYAVLAPHMGGDDGSRRAWLGQHKGKPMLFSQYNSRVLAFACSAPWKSTTIGFDGTNDGRQQLREHFTLADQYDEAENGNITLTGEVDLSANDGKFLIAIGMGTSEEDAGQKAHESLIKDFSHMKTKYVESWKDFQSSCKKLDGKDNSVGESHSINLYRVSTAVLKIHESKQQPGGIIASLSIPWGRIEHGDNPPGYHVVWPRDQVEAATALVAVGKAEMARQTVSYLLSTQEQDGHWPQNMWIEGNRVWHGIQTDETAFFILLADMLRRAKEIESCVGCWQGVRKAACFLVQYGPSTQQDRWEENSGYSAFTLSVVISGLLAAADFAESEGEEKLANYLRETADSWYDSIDDWIYVAKTELAKTHNVDGYYVRMTPKDGNLWEADPQQSTIEIKNRPNGQSVFPVREIVSPDALALVRFGLRAASDPRIVNTLTVIDATLKTETNSGPVWHRYTHDGYGEADDGSPFNVSGVGRGWPLLVGERAHYELARGNKDEAEKLLRAMEAMTGNGGLLPEQIWDAEDIPSRELINGKPSGSGMPLVWAHAEYIKLVRSLNDGNVFGNVPHARDRYLTPGVDRHPSHAVWRFDYQMGRMAPGRSLRVEALAPFRLHWGISNWTAVQNIDADDRGAGVFVADLTTANLTVGETINFTFYWPQQDRWEGQDFTIIVAAH